MSKSVENMEVSGSEDTETDYFQDVGDLDDNMDQSIDSLQGSLTLPTFAVEQSDALQGSHGFEVFCNSDLTQSASNKSYNNDGFQKLTNSGNYGFKSSEPSYGRDSRTSVDMLGIQLVTSGTTLPGSTLMFSHSQLGALNVLSPADKYHPVLPKENLDVRSSYLTKITLKSETTDNISSSEVVGSESAEGGSSDEKNGKCKSSPKRRGRKSRSTSCAGSEPSIKTETVTGPSPSRIDLADNQQSTSGEMGVKPSLLDEILTEKKLALLRSPEVLRFLQSQQQMIEREKKITHRKSLDS